MLGAPCSLIAEKAAGTPFTVADDIGVSHFLDPYAGENSAQSVQFSPDGSYLAAITERGRLDLNRPADTLHIYRTKDLLSFLRRSGVVQPPAPHWSFDRSTDQDGPIISNWRWLTDSTGVAFLERGAHGRNRLMLADLTHKTLRALSPEDAIIKGYAICDATNYVYATEDPAALQKSAMETKAPAIAATGRPLMDLLYPASQDVRLASLLTDRSELWAVVGGKHFRVRDKATAQAVVLFTTGLRNLALSPDGRSLVTALAVEEIPVAWELRYPPPYKSFPYRLRSGKQDLSTLTGDQLVSRYVRIDLLTGAIAPVSDGPTSDAAGWWTNAMPTWSKDGEFIALPNAFVVNNTQTQAQACVAVVSRRSTGGYCVEPIKGPSDAGSYENYQTVEDIRFEGVDGRKLSVRYDRNGEPGRTQYDQDASGAWVVATQVQGADGYTAGDLSVVVRQGLNDPPVLVATDSTTQVSRVVWDPNAQLKKVELGEATIYRWKDTGGRDWKGGLFRPVAYEAGRRYPLVIQTHGFSENSFNPSGVLPTAFAARALASAGLVVLQVQDCPVVLTPVEGPCNVDGYKAAVRQLVEEGLVDPARIGIIGFSRSCFYVMEALTTSDLQIKAASITDGIMVGYLQYLNLVDLSKNAVANEFNEMIGAPPFAKGMERWLERAPLLNMHKVSAALQVVVIGRYGLTYMWEPYAAMRYLHKPVDLILLNNSEHVLSNPSARMASQGGTVDWFRFWLQNYEDPDPAKAEQYQRWRELRKLQIAQDVERASASKEQEPAH